MTKISLMSLLIELSKKKKNRIIKYYTPELMLRKTSTGAEYEVSEIDMSDPDDPRISMFRYNVDGSLEKDNEHSIEEIDRDFEIA